MAGELLWADPERWEQLVRVSQQLMRAAGPGEIHRIVSDAARALTGADGATFISLDQGECHLSDEDASAPLWRCLCLPTLNGVPGSNVLHGVPIVVPDIQHDPRIVPEMYRATFIKSLSLVPVRKGDPLGAIGVYWTSHQRPNDQRLALLQALADTAAAALDKLALLHALEHKVRERTIALEAAYKEFQQLALVDDLTGLSNRRGFFVLAEQQRRRAVRSGEPAFVVFIDIDDLKRVNDTLGHEAGDQQLRNAARVLRATFRDSDIVARLGGDEFCVLAVDGACDPQRLRDRLQRGIEAFNADRGGGPFPLSASIGIHPCAIDDLTPLEQLVRQADRDMYVQKRRGRRVAVLAERREPGQPARREGSEEPRSGD